MDDSDKIRFAAAIEAAAVVYSKQVNALLKRSYFEALRDMPIAEVELAMSKHIATSRFFPTPSDLRKPENEEGMALEAYRIASNAMCRHGSYKHVDFDDKAINAALRAIGGWSVFGETTLDQEPIIRERFKKAYIAYRKMGVGDESGQPLAGLGEADRCRRAKDGSVIESRVEVVKIGSSQSTGMVIKETTQ